MDKILTGEQGEFSFKRLLERLFIDDWMMKLLALIITLGLWFGVTGSRKPTTERLENIALKLRTSNSMEITELPFKEVALVLTGDNRKIDQIRRENLTVSVDLIDAKPGNFAMQLTPDNVEVDLPAGVRIEQVLPSKISFKLETVEKREITVKAETMDNLPEGFEIYGISVIPQKIPVRGPTTYIDSLDSISTDKIDLKDHKEDFTAAQVPLNVMNAKVTVVDESVVNVFFRIGERRVERLFIVPVKNSKDRRTATIVLYGARTLLNSITAEDLQVELVKNAANAESIAVALPSLTEGKVEIRKQVLNGR
jgi:YbbR domain-containing protein